MIKELLEQVTEKKNPNMARVQFGDKNPNWKGDKISYKGLHDWIQRNKPKVEFCEECGEKKKLSAANISGKYKRDINDFKWLCRKCHFNFDGNNNFIKSCKRSKKGKLNPNWKGGKSK